jgi:hypothetical protein
LLYRGRVSSHEWIGLKNASKEAGMNSGKMNNTATLEKEDQMEKVIQEVDVLSGLEFGFNEFPSDRLNAWLESETEMLEGRE